MSFAGWTDRLGLAQNERFWITLVLVVLVGFGTFDFFEDLGQGATRNTLMSDVSDLILPVLLLVYIWRHLPLTTMRTMRSLQSQNQTRDRDLAHWRGIAEGYLDGLGVVIDQQLTAWSLTAAEKEVALLLLKGLSMREIGAVRGISERTARQQAGTVYSKSGLDGRAELSAFFLEDLLLPQPAP